MLTRFDPYTAAVLATEHTRHFQAEAHRARQVDLAIRTRRGSLASRLAAALRPVGMIRASHVRGWNGLRRRPAAAVS